jgi:DNA-binding NtrC family response regulator
LTGWWLRQLKVRHIIGTIVNNRQDSNSIMANILVVDDELGIRDLLSEILNDEGHQVDLAENAAQARLARANARPDLVLLDIWMPDTDGVTLLKEWSSSGLLTMPVIMMSGHATIDTAVEATKIGAIAFLEKPITLQKLLKAVEQGLTRSIARPLVSACTTSTSTSTASPSSASSSTSSAAPGALACLADCSAEAVLPGGLLMAVADPGPQATQSFFLEKPLRDARDEFEKAYFEFHLIKEGGSMTRVAEKTGLERTHLYRKLKQLGVDLSRGKRIS